MSITKFNINKVSMNSDLKPDSSANNRSLGTSSKKWKDAYLSDTLYLAATSKLSIADVAVTAGAAEINVLTGSGLAASDMSTLAGLALDGVTGLAQADFTKLAALDASATEINYLASFADSTFAQASDSIVFWDADASAIRHETTAAFLGAVSGDGFEVDSSKLKVLLDESSAGDSGLEVGSDGLKISAAKVTNAMLAGSIANSKLANSTISGVALGGTLGALSDGNGIADFSYTGAGTASIAIELDEASAGDSGLEVGSDGLKISAAKVTNAMLAGSIANAKLANSTVSGVALGGTLGALSDGNGIADFSYTGAGTASIAIELDESSAGDSGLEVGSDGLKISAAKVTNAMLAGSIANAKLANSAVTVTAGDGLSGGGSVSLGGTVSLAVDMNELTAAEVDVANDSFMIIDATDNSSKKESVADLVDAMAGDGLVATNGVLSISPQQHYFMMSQAESTSSGLSGRALPEGSTAAGTASSGVRTLTVAIPSGGDYVTESLQVFCNGMLLRKDAGTSASTTYDYYCAATSGGSFVITLRADDDGDSPLADDDDVVTVRYIKKD